MPVASIVLVTALLMADSTPRGPAVQQYYFETANESQIWEHLAGGRPSVRVGSHRLDQKIELTDRNHLASDTVVGFYDVAGTKYREGWVIGVGQRFE